VTATAWWAAVIGVGVAVAVGAYVTAVADRAIAALVARDTLGWSALAGPVRSVALGLVQSRTTTERPDGPAWALAPALYLGLGAAGLAVVPLSATLVAADVDGGLVLFGAVQALAVIPVFLNGWSSNSMLPLIGAFRFIAQALSYEMPNLLALLSVSVPASSLALGDIVASQQHLWNVVRIPLGLPLFLFAAAGLAFWGPVNLPDGADVAGGTALHVGLYQDLAREIAALDLRRAPAFLDGGDL